MQWNEPAHSGLLYPLLEQSVEVAKITWGSFMLRSPLWTRGML